MAITLEDLIDQLPAGTEAQVRLARDRARQPIREAMRAECGLSMRGLGAADDGDVKAQVPIYVLPGYPEHIALLSFPNEFAPVLLLARYGRQLGATAEAMLDLIDLNRQLRAVQSGAALVLQPDAPLRQSQEWAAHMLLLVEQHDPVRQILCYSQDVLGTYQCKGPAGEEFRPNSASIGLYWGVIGFVSQGLGCSVEDLTVVVLAHEVAHAYTQLGADTDGRRWPVEMFCRSEVTLVESLAQYYAERTLKRLRSRYPNAHAVFQQLLAKQPPPYHAHEPWAPHVAPEAVRRAMLEVRRKGELSLAEFERRLDRAADEFTLIGPADTARYP